MGLLRNHEIDYIATRDVALRPNTNTRIGPREYAEYIEVTAWRTHDSFLFEPHKTFTNDQRFEWTFSPTTKSST